MPDNIRRLGSFGSVAGNGNTTVYTAPAGIYTAVRNISGRLTGTASGTTTNVDTYATVRIGTASNGTAIIPLYSAVYTNGVQYDIQYTYTGLIILHPADTLQIYSELSFITVTYACFGVESS